MLKRFFSSGVLVHPLVLAGLIAGAYFVYKFDIETIKSIFMYYDYYLVIFTVAFLYTIFFEMAFKARGHAVDWKITFSRTINSAVRVILANVISIFVSYFIDLYFF